MGVLAPKRTAEASANIMPVHDGLGLFRAIRVLIAMVRPDLRDKIGVLHSPRRSCFLARKHVAGSFALKRDSVTCCVYEMPRPKVSIKEPDMKFSLSIARKTSAVLSVTILSTFAMAGCGQDNTQTSASPPTGEPAGPIFRTFMVEVVGPATKPIWDFGYADAVTDQGWERINKGATDLVASLTTISTGGAVPAEQERAKSPVWQEWTMKLSDTAAAAKSAADGKNQAALATAGDTLAEVCQGCHVAFDPTAK